MLCSKDQRSTMCTWREILVLIWNIMYVCMNDRGEEREEGLLCVSVVMREVVVYLEDNRNTVGASWMCSTWLLRGTFPVA